MFTYKRTERDSACWHMAAIRLNPKPFSKWRRVNLWHCSCWPWLLWIGFFFFPKPSKCFTALSTRGDSARVHTCDKNWATDAFGTQQDSHPTATWCNVLSLYVLFFFFQTMVQRQSGKAPRFSFFFVLPALPVALDVLRFLFIIPETLWSGTGPKRKKRQFVFKRLVPFQIKYFDSTTNKKFMEEKRKMDFLSNLRKNWKI